MVFKGNANVDRFYFHIAGEENNEHWIDLTMSVDAPSFVVSCCCDEDWSYEFWYTKSDYTRVVFNIMEAVFECEDMDSLMRVLSEIFEDGFADILIKEERECDCDGSCENCKCKG